MSEQEENNGAHTEVPAAEEELTGPEAGQEPQPAEEAAVDPEAMSPEERLARAESKAAEYLDGWQRARAELQNVKKRTEREREQLTESIRGDLALSLLPVLDDLDLAVESLPDGLAGHEWANGVLLIHKKLIGQLAAMGIEEIEAQGAPFDPSQHEAVSQVPGNGAEPHTVVTVLRKGYRLNGKVIRAALVHVAE